MPELAVAWDDDEYDPMTSAWTIGSTVPVLIGSGVPGDIGCREKSKSAIELEYYAEIRRSFENARSGVALKDDAFARGTIWRPDIICRINSINVAIEYDGAYWHAGKIDTDTRKSLDLLDAGWVMIRLRETGLPSLVDLGSHYKELAVDGERTKPATIIGWIINWIDTDRQFVQSDN